MLKISKSRISITRGDSAYIEIFVNNQDGTPYVLEDGDTVQCQIRTRANDGELLVDASLDNGKLYIDESDTIIWHIVPADTRELDIGSYRYDVQLVTGSEDVYTFIENATFNVTDEVTFDE